MIRIRHVPLAARIEFYTGIVTKRNSAGSPIVANDAVPLLASSDTAPLATVSVPKSAPSPRISTVSPSRWLIPEKLELCAVRLQLVVVAGLRLVGDLYQITVMWATSVKAVTIPTPSL